MYRLLFVLVLLAHDRRRIRHVGVTAHPTAAWTAQQLREAFPWDEAPRYSEGRHRPYPLTWSPPFDTSKKNVRADVEVCRPAQRTDGARGVQITRGMCLIGDQMDFLVGTGGSRL